MLSLKESCNEENNIDKDINYDESEKSKEFSKYFIKYFIESNKAENSTNSESDSDYEIIYKKQNENNSENINNNQLTISLEEDKESNKKKRGRKKNDEKGSSKTNIHSKDEIGNMCSKIKNNYHNYLIEFFNHKIREKNNGKQIVKFRKIKYDITNIRNKTANKNLLKLPIKEILKSNISTKYKNSPADQNYHTLNKIYPIFSEYLDMSYEDFYTIHYLNNKEEENDNHKHSFKNFIEKKKKKNETQYFNKLVEISYKYIDYYNKKIEKKNKKFLNIKRDKNNNNSLFAINIK